MKKICILLILLTTKIFSQGTSIDTIMPATEVLLVQNDSDSTSTVSSETFYKDYDLQQIDSLLTDAKFNSPLFNGNEYVIKENELSSNADYIVDTDVLKSRLAEINATTPFHLEYNPSLEKVINSYVKRRRKYYPALMARAKYYFPIFEQYLDKYDIPLEMKYLAIVESALRPKVKSPVGATGLWQFMYGTGKQFKLKINSYIDERQDPIKSTEAACKYLKQLHARFGDWDLALAAYNSGPGNVLKAIKRSGGHRNYWNIRGYLPYETAGYVPAFYATMYIFKHAEELDLHSKKPKLYYFETDTVQVKQAISFKNISEKIGVNTDVLQLLNPKYKKNYIPYSSEKTYSVRLPRNKTLEFLEKEQHIYALANYDISQREKPLAKYVAANSSANKGRKSSKRKGKRIRYKVKKGDFLGKIARRFGVKVSQIKRWNNIRSSRLNIGQRLSIYRR